MVLLLVLGPILGSVLGLVPGARAAERLHRFGPADAAALRAWAGILREDGDLRQAARRHRFVPGRDLAALWIDLDGDGRQELILHAELLPYCGSAGCVARILTRRDGHPGGNWALACETHVEGGNGFVVDTARSAGWRNLRGTWRMSWRKDASQPAGIVCVQGEPVPRSLQDRPAPGSWP